MSGKKGMGRERPHSRTATHTKACMKTVKDKGKECIGMYLVIIYIYYNNISINVIYYFGMVAPNGFLRCTVYALMSLFLCHISPKLWVEVKASGPPHVLELWLG